MEAYCRWGGQGRCRGGDPAGGPRHRKNEEDQEGESEDGAATAVGIHEHPGDSPRRGREAQEGEMGKAGGKEGGQASSASLTIRLESRAPGGDAGEWESDKSSGNGSDPVRFG